MAEPPSRPRNVVRALADLEHLLGKRMDLLRRMQALAFPGGGNPGNHHGDHHGDPGNGDVGAARARMEADVARLEAEAKRVLATLESEVPPANGHRRTIKPIAE